MHSTPEKPIFAPPAVLAMDPTPRLPRGGELTLSRPGLLAGGYRVAVRLPGQAEREVVLDYPAQALLLLAWYLTQCEPLPLPRTAEEWIAYNKSWSCAEGPELRGGGGV